MTKTGTTGTKRRWRRMEFAHVGDVSVVMEKKTGPHFDPSPQHTIKRGNGPKNP